MIITEYNSLTDNSGTERTIDWSEFCSMIDALPVAASKNEQLLVKLAQFSGTRSNKNLSLLWGIEVDYDAEQVRPEFARDMLSMLGVESIIYTTARHTDAKPRWRAMFPFSVPRPPEYRDQYVQHIDNILGGTLAKESYTPSQSYFVGRVEGSEYLSLRTRGVELDELFRPQPIAESAPARSAVDNNALAFARAAPEDQVAKYLNMIENPGADWHYWNNICMAVWAASNGAEWGLELMRDWSARGGIENPSDDIDKRWSAITRCPPDTIGIQKLKYLCRASIKTVDEEDEEFMVGHITNVYMSKYPGTVYYNGQFYGHDGSRYKKLIEHLMRRRIRICAQEELKLHTINTCVDELKSACLFYEDESGLPCWLDESKAPPDVDAKRLISCRNGLLDPVTGVLHRHTYNLLTMNSVPFDYDVEAPTPENWLKFTEQTLPPDSLRELQKWFGYSLTQDTKYQKIFVMSGQRRSGKGTIARILEELIGKNNTVSPSLTSFGTEFGLQSAIGKQLITIRDARLSSRADKSLIAEKLLNISGEDAILINRKHIDPWEGKLNAKIMIFANEIPSFSDNANALASRYIFTQTKQSFEGREDRHLIEKLQAELPAILNWALEGLALLNAEGFIQPESSLELVTSNKHLNNPIQMFIDECCILNAFAISNKDQLYQGYLRWHEEQNTGIKPYSKPWFSRQILNRRNIKTVRRNDDGNKRAYCYHGIQIA